MSELMVLETWSIPEQYHDWIGIGILLLVLFIAFSGMMATYGVRAAKYGTALGVIVGIIGVFTAAGLSKETASVEATSMQDQLRQKHGIELERSFIHRQLRPIVDDDGEPINKREGSIPVKAYKTCGDAPALLDMEMASKSTEWLVTVNCLNGAEPLEKDAEQVSSGPDKGN